MTADGSADPALFKCWGGNGDIKVGQERVDESVQEDGFDSIVVGDESVWFHKGELVAVLVTLPRVLPVLRGVLL